MAFEGGDIVPAMRQPGGRHCPGGVVDKIAKMPENSGGTLYQIHAPVQLHATAMDEDGVNRALKKHGEQFQKHFENTLRRMHH
jgi:hypothetical protein